MQMNIDQIKDFLDQQKVEQFPHKHRYPVKLLTQFLN